MEEVIDNLAEEEINRILNDNALSRVDAKCISDFKECIRSWIGAASLYKKEKSVWEETARQYAGNTEFYRDLLDQVAYIIGKEAFIDDAGGVHDSPIRLKIPQLVAEMKKSLPGHY